MALLSLRPSCYDLCQKENRPSKNSFVTLCYQETFPKKAILNALFSRQNKLLANCLIQFKCHQLFLLSNFAKIVSILLFFFKSQLATLKLLIYSSPFSEIICVLFLTHEHHVFSQESRNMWGPQEASPLRVKQVTTHTRLVIDQFVLQLGLKS